MPSSFQPLLPCSCFLTPQLLFLLLRPLPHFSRPSPHISSFREPSWPASSVRTQQDLFSLWVLTVYVHFCLPTPSQLTPPHPTNLGVPEDRGWHLVSTSVFLDQPGIWHRVGIRENESEAPVDHWPDTGIRYYLSALAEGRPHYKCRLQDLLRHRCYTVDRC